MRVAARWVGSTAALLLLAATTVVTGAAPSYAAESTCDGKAPTADTTFADGVWTGTDDDDVIIVSGDSVEVRALAGNDTICVVGDNYPDPSFARLYGGSGDDSMFADWGHDVLVGGPGADYLYGGTNNDTYVGGPGDDVLDGSCSLCGFEARYNDSAVFRHLGDVEVDLLEGTATSTKGTDTLIDIADATTGGGDDVLRGTSESNRLDGGAGDDTLVGRADHDNLTGGPGRDRADGGSGKDRCTTERTTSCEK